MNTWSEEIWISVALLIVFAVVGCIISVVSVSYTHLKKAMEKAELEYKKYNAKPLSDVERDYLDAIKELENLK